jgi:predicted transcriptional regulator
VSCNPLATRFASAEYTFSAIPRFHHLEIPAKPEMQRSLFELMLKVLNSMPLISVGFL